MRPGARLEWPGARLGWPGDEAGVAWGQGTVWALSIH